MTTSQLCVTLKLRSFPSYGITDIQDGVLLRLNRLVDAGKLASIDIEVWGGHAVSDAMMTSADKATIETVSGFERWAARRGYTLAPAFTYRECGLMLDDIRETPVVPLVTLAVYEGERLRAVYPYSDGEHVRTVNDGLEALEALSPPTDDRADALADGRDPSADQAETTLPLVVPTP